MITYLKMDDLVVLFTLWLSFWQSQNKFDGELEKIHVLKVIMLGKSYMPIKALINEKNSLSDYLY